MKQVIIYFVLFLSLLLLVDKTEAKEPLMKIVIIDTGASLEILSHKKKYHLCEGAHYDATNSGLIDGSKTGHGSMIIKTINKYAGNSDYCLYLIKYYRESNTDKENILSFIRALNHVTTLKNINAVNISVTGVGYNTKERTAVLSILNKGIKIIAAAGNDHANLDKIPYYPAMYHRDIIVVNNLVFKNSNYGKYIDYSVVERTPNGATSSATAKVTGRLIRIVNDKYITWHNNRRSSIKSNKRKSR